MAKKLTREEIESIRKAMGVELERRPPTIGLIGVSGVGKSSTINAMFKTNLAISHTVACTKKFEATELSLHIQKGEMFGEQAKLTVIDAPGLGEDIALDPKYIRMYKEHLPECDVLLWVLSARNRGMALDQQYLREFGEHAKRMVFGINQVDLVHPMNWNENINLPSDEMDENIDEICKDRAKKISDVMGAQASVTAYSAARGYNLEKLFNAIIHSIQDERKWIYDGLKNFSYRDFVPPELLQGKGGETSK